MARWDSYTEIRDTTCSTRPDAYVHEVYAKDGLAYVAWNDIASDDFDSKISVFKTGDLVLNTKAMKQQGGLDALFACEKIHEEKTDSRLDQGGLVDALDLKLRAAAVPAEAEKSAPKNHGAIVVENIAARPGF